MQKFVLADLKVGGKPHAVIMQANKNGFFYVLDRKTGKLLSAKPFSYVNWASRIDMKSGRPVVTAQADWYVAPKNIYPVVGRRRTPGIRCPIARSTHLVYIPVIDVPAVWVDLLMNGGRCSYIDGFFTVNGIISTTPTMPPHLQSAVWAAA